MKLEPRPKTKRIKAAEALGTPDEQLDLLFDVEKEVPRGEFEQYKRLLVGEEPASEYEKKKIVASAWYGLLHPEYRELMRQSSWLKQFWVNDIVGEMPADPPERPEGTVVFEEVEHGLSLASDFVQVFPENRADLKLAEYSYDWLVRHNPPSEELQIYSAPLLLLKLWPDRREKIMSLYFPEGAPTALGEINDNWSVSTRLLLFPELRPVARSHLNQKREQYVKEISYWREHFNAGVFNDYLKNLAILSAAHAWIDETGREHIEMPKAGMRHDRPLPDRPQV